MAAKCGFGMDVRDIFHPKVPTQKPSTVIPERKSKCTQTFVCLLFLSLLSDPRCLFAQSAHNSNFHSTPKMTDDRPTDPQHICTCATWAQRQTEFNWRELRVGQNPPTPVMHKAHKHANNLGGSCSYLADAPPEPPPTRLHRCTMKQLITKNS